MGLNAKRLYRTLIGLVVLSLLLIAGGVYAAGKVLQQKSGEVYDAKLKSLTLEKQQTDLRKARADIERYKDLAEIAKNIVPRDKDQARTVREISKLAEANNIKLGALTFPSSSLGQPNAAGGQDSQLEPVSDIPGTFILEVTVRSDSGTPVAYDDFINFLQALEQNRRTALVTGITITPDTNNPNNLQFTLTLDEYLKP
jgi:hypothetical protein